MTPTIKDIAKKANVSIATVSLAIHDNPRISDETKQKIMRVIKELNYHPSRSARGLVSQKTGNIGFILTENHFLRSEPFYTQIFLGAEYEAHQHDYYLLLTTVPESAGGKIKLPRFVLERNVDGIIIAGKVPPKLVEKLESTEIPMVFVDFETGQKETNAVLIDNNSGAKLAVEHLLKIGHRNIVFAGGDISHPSIRSRFNGFKSALEDAGIAFGESNYYVEETDTLRENGYNAGKIILERCPGVTAVFACNDAMAMGVMQFLQENGKAVPDEISVVGFDDVDAAQTVIPGLTTISVPKFELGCEAIRLMERLLVSKTITSNIVTVGVELAVRKSTAEVKQ